MRDASPAHCSPAWLHQRDVAQRDQWASEKKTVCVGEHVLKASLTMAAHERGLVLQEQMASVSTFGEGNAALLSAPLISIPPPLCLAWQSHSSPLHLPLITPEPTPRSSKLALTTVHPNLKLNPITRELPSLHSTSTSTAFFLHFNELTPALHHLQTPL